MSRLSTISIILLGLGTVPTFGQNALTLTDQVALEADPIVTPVFVTNDTELEAFTLAVKTTPAGTLDSVGADLSGTIPESVGAESVFVSLFPSAVTVGVFLDTDPPFDGQSIPVGGDQHVANLEWQTAVPVGAPTVVNVEFADGIYDTPPVFNEIVTRLGAAIGVAEGLALVNGQVTVLPGAVSLSLQGGAIDPLQVGTSDVVLDNTAGNLEAFVLAVQHPAATLQLVAIGTLGTDTGTALPEFVASEIQPSGGILTVIFDFELPLDGNSLAPGTGLVLAHYDYLCLHPPTAPELATSHDIDFVDGVLGFPPMDNVLNIDGYAISAPTSPGTMTCEAIVPPDGSFYSGRFDDTTSSVVDMAAPAGATVEVSFFYSEPDDDIQGFELVICHDCRLTVESACLDLAGSVLEAVGAEFVNCLIDDVDDGDGCHFAAGILLDALPPFGGQTLPTSDTPEKLGSLEIHIDDSATEGELLSMTFCSWTTGGTTIDNTIVADGLVQLVPNLFGHVIEIVPPSIFLRGDCNNDGQVDLADPILVLNIIFFDQAPIGCSFACDHNGDSNFDVADFIYMVNYFFLDGPPPPAPFPDCGTMVGALCETPTACP